MEKIKILTALIVVLVVWIQVANYEISTYNYNNTYGIKLENDKRTTELAITLGW